MTWNDGFEEGCNFGVCRKCGRFHDSARTVSLSSFQDMAQEQLAKIRRLVDQVEQTVQDLFSNRYEQNIESLKDDSRALMAEVTGDPKQNPFK